MRILVVEDEPKIAGFLSAGLSEEAHTVQIAASLEAAREAVRGTSFDLWLVDRMLPDGDGVQWLQEQRRAGRQTAAICLTARDRVSERVEGLRGGADDYLVKPFAFDELLARIAAVARRTTVENPQLIVGDLSIDRVGHRVTRAGEELQFSPQEFRLLAYLAEHAGEVLSRTRLLAAVWDTHHDPGTNVVDVYIGYVRHKLDRGAVTPLLHTVRGIGYVLDVRPRSSP